MVFGKTNGPNNKGIIQTNQSSFSTLYRLTDLILITLVFFSTMVILGEPVKGESMVILFVNIITFNLCAESLDLYRSWRTASTTLMLRSVTFGWLISGFVTATFAYVYPNFVNLDNFVVMSWLTISLVALTSWRVVFRQILFVHRRKGHNTRRAIVIGATHAGYSLANQIIENDHLGIIFTGVYDDRETQRLPYEFTNQIAGNVDDAIEKARQGEVDFVYIALPMSAEKRIMQVLNLCSDTTATVYIIPNFFMYNLLNARWQSVGSIQTLSVFDTPFQGGSELLKRAEDIVLSLSILCLIAVPMLCIAAAVKITSPGPVIFRQNRYGLDGKKIVVYKFRSMSAQDNGTEVKQATKNDSRITPLGAFLRKTSLDELPQFINVLQGRMSIVGPRPHAVAHNEQYRKLIEGYMLRHKVRPGITGLAQVNGLRGETETINKMVKRVEFDLDYIHRWSVWLDIKIILKTVTNGFINKNAY
ncbi:MAG: undecaprenyl-phosphate glucose phosphotransferase [Paraglaciecola sp.]|nr:undecaprenyl-phosphate glucose phosphotransferase [Paraglaciecola sp.]NCT46737.1 undecaprenyl-phosphate glucose phosphotransferase [Paraglaciecola sp.]